MTTGHLIVDDVAGNISVTVHEVRPLIPGLPFPAVCVPIYTDILDRADALRLRDRLTEVLDETPVPYVPRRLRVRQTPAGLWRFDCPAHPVFGLYVDQPSASRAASKHLTTHHQLQETR